MTQEETKERIEVMQAYADGKKIEVDAFKNGIWTECITPNWDWLRRDFRIAPEQEEKQYRPYTMDEFVEDMVIHGTLIKIEDAVRKQYVSPTCISSKGVKLNDDIVTYESLQTMFYSWQDGTRCRKEITVLKRG